MARRKFARLKSALYEAELTQADIARACGRGTTYISRRMNGREPFNTADMLVIGRLLDLPRDQWLNYFVDGPVQEGAAYANR